METTEKVSSQAVNQWNVFLCCSSALLPFRFRSTHSVSLSGFSDWNVYSFFFSHGVYLCTANIKCVRIVREVGVERKKMHKNNNNNNNGTQTEEKCYHGTSTIERASERKKKQYTIQENCVIDCAKPYKYGNVLRSKCLRFHHEGKYDKKLETYAKIRYRLLSHSSIDTPF